MFAFLLVIHAIIAATLVTVILMQRSEGGGLGMGQPVGADVGTRRGGLSQPRDGGAGDGVRRLLDPARRAGRDARAPAIDTSLARTPATQAPITQPAPGPVPTGAAPAQQPADNSAVPLAR